MPGGSYLVDADSAVFGDPICFVLPKLLGQPGILPNIPYGWRLEQFCIMFLCVCLQIEFQCTMGPTGSENRAHMHACMARGQVLLPPSPTSLMCLCACWPKLFALDLVAALPHAIARIAGLLLRCNGAGENMQSKTPPDAAMDFFWRAAPWRKIPELCGAGVRRATQAQV